MTSQLSLFPNEVNQYDLYIIRELLHNCIAHQKYNLKGRIYIIEFKYKLMLIAEMKKEKSSAIHLLFILPLIVKKLARTGCFKAYTWLEYEY